MYRYQPYPYLLAPNKVISKINMYHIIQRKGNEQRNIPWSDTRGSNSHR